MASLSLGDEPTGFVNALGDNHGPGGVTADPFMWKTRRSKLIPRAAVYHW